VLHAQREGMVPTVACAVVVSSVPLGKVRFSSIPVEAIC
jgi:hypothetical protein